MSRALAVKFGQDTERFAFNDISLGAEASEVIAHASKQYGQQPVCKTEKSGFAVVKKAKTQQTCLFSSLHAVKFAEQRVVEISYTFINNRFEKLDIELEEITDQSKDVLLKNLTASFGIEYHAEGPVTSWAGKNDVAMLVRQGNYKLHMTNRVYLPENTNYNKLTLRK